MADSRALGVAIDAYQACHFIGMPECSVHLTHAVIYCSLAPKSNAMETAYNSAKADALRMLDEPVPMNIRNAPTSPHEGSRFRKGLSVRPRLRRPHHRHAVSSGFPRGKGILRSLRSGIGSEMGRTPAPDPGMEKRAPGKVIFPLFENRRASAPRTRACFLSLHQRPRNLFLYFLQLLICDTLVHAFAHDLERGVPAQTCSGQLPAP